MKAEDANKISLSARAKAKEKQTDLQHRLIMHHAGEGRYACPILGAIYPDVLQVFVDRGYVIVGKYLTWDEAEAKRLIAMSDKAME